MKRFILALLLAAPAFSVVIPQQDPLPKCWPCPPSSLPAR
jgi:hypothetical protein